MTFSFRPQEAAVTGFPCSRVAPSISAGVGCVLHGPKLRNCLLFRQGLPRQEVGKTPSRVGKLWEADRTETEMSIVILHFPELVFSFCVIQNDCNWEYIWNKQALWLSNMSALLFMFICRLCNSYKLLLHDRLLHLKFSLLNSSSSFIFLTA